MANADYRELYRWMKFSRLFEENTMVLWKKGKIFGEMHLAIGEEAIAAGIVRQLQPDDALALDHRGTPQMLMKGVDAVKLMLELLGHEQGLCRGQGGHMHLFSRGHWAASSGIVGAAGPAAVGFALANKRLRPGRIAVAFFGEGAINQGMLMESFNLAAVWNLPVLFVCKDNKWAITTPSRKVTAGDPVDRARAFGIKSCSANGSDIDQVWQAADKALAYCRKESKPFFLHLTCFRPQGHFLGDPLLRVAKHPMGEMKKLGAPLLKAAWRGRSSRSIASLRKAVGTIGTSMKDQFLAKEDPLIRMVNAGLLSDQEAKKIDGEEERRMTEIISKVEALAGSDGNES